MYHFINKSNMDHFFNKSDIYHRKVTADSETFKIFPIPLLLKLIFLK